MGKEAPSTFLGQGDSFKGGEIMKMAVLSFLVSVLLGTIGMTGLAWAQGTAFQPTQPKPLEPAPVIKRVEPSPPTFESTMKKALDLYASLISRASPQVRTKINASALAFKNYLAQCSRNCDLYQFCLKDLMARFTSLTDSQLHLLMTLVFAEATSNMSQQMQFQLQGSMQIENRIFTTISNVLKTQHDTLNASISNIR
jgi:hypothetical protein